ncbi:MAG TPA: hypothetical protein VFQ40_02480, partial [Actinomycetota bacterium]|nr:hypothetical protein [Actinomycetota bacterium]
MGVAVEHTIEAGILALHSVDADMAKYQNMRGFNGRDTAIGNSFAFQIKQGKKLSPRQRAVAYKILRTYKVQLLRDFGIDYEQIVDPGTTNPELRDAVTGAARFDRGAIVVKFSGYPGDLLFKVKNIPGMRYDRETQEWRVALT